MRDDGDLGDRLRVLFQRRHQRVPHLMIGNNALLHIGEYRALLLGARDDHFKGNQKVLVVDRLPPQTYRPEGRLVDQIGQIGAHRAGGGGGNLMQIHVLGELDVAGVHQKGLITARKVGLVDNNPPVKPARAQQRLVQHLGAVGGGEDDDPLGGVKAVHLGQKLVQGLLPLVVAPHAGVTGLADGVDLVNENDGRGHLGRLLEQIAHAARAHAHEHLHKPGARDGEKRHVGFAGHRLSQQRLAGAGRAHQQRALGQLRANVGVFLRVVEKINDLLQALLGLILAGHVLEGDAGLLFHVDLGVGLADAAEAAPHALGHGAHQEGEQQIHHRHRQHPGEQEGDDGAGLFDDFAVHMRAVVLELGDHIVELEAGDAAGEIDGLAVPVLPGLFPCENQNAVGLELHRIHLILVHHGQKFVVGNRYELRTGNGLIKRVD